MQRPMWEGHISFGLINIPVLLFSAEKKGDLHFKLIDARNHARIRYERVNEQTGEEVPWSSIAKAYEFKKGNFVILQEKDFERAAAEHLKTIEIDGCVNSEALECAYFDKPYYLMPDTGGEKGYSLLREVLNETRKAAIAKIIIRTRPHIAAVLPHQHLLILNILRYAQELRKPDEFKLPSQESKLNKISSKEKDIAMQLVEAMSMKWHPEYYHDEYRDTLMRAIDKKSRSKGKKRIKPKNPAKAAENNVIDFVSLLQKSVKDKKHRR
jgi:DNA end-binding protein Ku